MNGAKTWFWILLDALIAAVIIVVLFAVIPFLGGWKDSLPSARTITVSAQGMATVTPDEADLTFSVVSQGQNPQALSTDNNTKMSSVLQFVAAQGVASSDIATTGYNLQPNYQFQQDTQTNIIIGYTLTQTVMVKIRDLTKVASVLGGLAPLGVNEVGGVDFTFQNPQQFIALARADAVSKAQNEANQMAAQANTSIGQVISIQESSNLPGPQPIFAMSSGASAGGIAASTPTIAPGTQNVTDQVTITYALK